MCSRMLVQGIVLWSPQGLVVGTNGQSVNPHELQPGTELELFLSEPPDDQLWPIPWAIVLWNFGRAAGVEILSMPEETKRRIRNFMKKHSTDVMVASELEARQIILCV